MNVPPHITPSKHLLERCYEKNLDINKVNETLYNPDKIEPHSKSAHKTVHKKKILPTRWIYNLYHIYCSRYQSSRSINSIFK